MRLKVYVASVLCAYFLSPTANAQLQGSISFTGEIESITVGSINIGGELYQPETDAFAIGDDVNVTITWNLAEMPIGRPLPGLPGLMYYEFDPSQFAIGGDVGGIPLSNAGPVTIGIGNDIVTSANPVPADTWVLNYGLSNYCPPNFDDPTSPTVSGGVSMGDRTGTAFSSGDFQVPTSDAPFTSSQFSVFAGVVDPRTQACITAAVSYARGAITMTATADVDDDGVQDATDNCPTVANTDQLDMNNDGYGDACVAVTSFISDRASLGSGVILGQRARVVGAVQAGEELSVGARSWVLGPNVLGDDVTIGSRSLISRGVAIGNDTEIGDSVTVFLNVDIGSGVTIGNRVALLRRASVGNNVTIGNAVRISALAVIGDGATIGNNVVVGAGARVAPGAVVPNRTRIAAGGQFP